ncbi:hypothetical protein [Kaarinaea lacus]
MKNYIVACTLFILAGCSADNDVIGSCQSALLDDRSVVCIDYYEAKSRDQWRTACETAIRGKWSSMACDTSSAFGGCKAGNKVIWMYPSEKHLNTQDAEQSCVAKNRLFLPVPVK